MRNKPSRIRPPPWSSSLLSRHCLPCLLNRLRSMHGSVLHRVLHSQNVLTVEIEAHACIFGPVAEVVAVASPLPPFNPHVIDLRVPSL